MGPYLRYPLFTALISAVKLSSLRFSASGSIVPALFSTMKIGLRFPFTLRRDTKGPHRNKPDRGLKLSTTKYTKKDSKDFVLFVCFVAKISAFGLATERRIGETGGRENMLDFM